MARKFLFCFLSSLVVVLLAAAPAPAEQRIDVPIGASQVKGPADAPVTFIEFLDFQ